MEPLYRSFHSLWQQSPVAGDLFVAFVKNPLFSDEKEAIAKGTDFAEPIFIPASKNKQEVLLNAHDAPYLLSSLFCLGDVKSKHEVECALIKQLSSFIWNKDDNQPIFDEYLTRYGDLPVEQLPVYIYGTPLQIEVWRKLTLIAPGDTCSYGNFSALVRKASFVRPVSTAVSHNPINLLLPCHRVVYSSREIGKYRWGSDYKASLLEKEKNSTPDDAPFATLNKIFRG